jgi:hypothetical protein
MPNTKLVFFVLFILCLVFFVLIYVIEQESFFDGEETILIASSSTHSSPRFVFFDLGANNGDSVLLFFEIKYNGSQKLNINLKLNYCIKKLNSIFIK